jgi:hypothetical protein
VIYADTRCSASPTGLFPRVVWRRDGESFARVRLPESILKDAESRHPSGSADACFHALTRNTH